jgi:hypothetical protein
MMNLLWTACLLAHVIGDFYLQSERMSEAKKKSGWVIGLHSLIYGIPFAFLLTLFRYSGRLALALLLIIISHLLIDILKFICTRLAERLKDRNLLKKEGFIYLADQVLHILSIFFVLRLAGISELNYTAWIQWILGNVLYSESFIIRWILLIFLLYKPVNITIHKLFSSFKPEDGKKKKEDISVIKLIAATVNPQDIYDTVYENDSENLAKKDKRAGAVIGFLERVLIVIFLSLQQFAAIGFVLTAKSIVRFDRITKDKEFAEYYLIGTLSSFIFALVFYYLLFGLSNIML